MERVLILGRGLVGNALYEGLKERGVDVRVSEDRIHSKGDVYNALKARSTTVVINAIGYTGSPNVDACEDNKDETYFTNVEIPRMIAQVTAELGIRMVHISSGCIYSGPGVFSEEDEPNFEGSFYSFTKKVAERLISGMPHVLTLRLRMPLTDDRNPRSILSKVLKYFTLIDTPNSITFLPDFVRATHALIESGSTGIYNIVNPQPATHYELVEAYSAATKRDCMKGKTLIPPEELKTRVPRSNCVLSSKKIEKIVKMTPTATALRMAAKGHRDDLPDLED